MFTLKVRENFEAAHRLPDYPGKCNRLHGHSWQVEAAVEGKKTDDLGMLVDFKLLKHHLREILVELDHQYLNELPAFANGYNPTAENLAQLIFNRLKTTEIFKSDVRLAAITVWESEHSCVTYTPE